MSPWPPSPTDRRRRQLLAGILAVLVIIAAEVFVGVSMRDDESTETSTTEPTTDEVPDEPEPTPTNPPTQAELDAAVADISDFVEEERGLEFREAVNVELEDDPAFQDRLLEDLDQETARLVEIEVLYKALGLIDPDDSLTGDLSEMMIGGVVGFYDPVSKELVVRGAALTPYVREVMAHELVHALDDQHFDLDRPEYQDVDDEIGFGFSALVEGNAVHIEEVFVRTQLTDDEQETAMEEEMDLVAGAGMPDVSFALLEYFVAPYVYGPGLVDALLEDGGLDRLNLAFGAPPTTSEQVLRPGAYLAGEGPIAVAQPTADGEVVIDGMLGQLFIEKILDDAISGRDAEEAADGWGGDAFVAWSAADRSCLRATMAGDTAEDNDELYAAWSEWADDGHVDASVEQAGAGQPLTLSSCVG